MYKSGAQLHFNNWSKLSIYGNSPAVQWLGLHAFTAESWGSIPGRRTKIPQVTQHSQKKNKTKLSIWVKSNYLNLKLKIKRLKKLPLPNETLDVKKVKCFRQSHITGKLTGDKSNSTEKY